MTSSAPKIMWWVHHWNKDQYGIGPHVSGFETEAQARRWADLLAKQCPDPVVTVKLFKVTDELVGSSAGGVLHDQARPVDRLTFRSPINSEGSWGERNLAKDAESTMDLYLYPSGQGEIEWICDELDICEHIGLEIEFNAYGSRTLVGYDGVMSLPKQAMELCERWGINCADMRKTESA